MLTLLECLNLGEIIFQAAESWPEISAWLFADCPSCASGDRVYCYDRLGIR